MYENEREVALRAVREANAMVRAGHARGAVAATKGDHPLNLVTETDVAVEEVLIERLSQAFPDDAVLGEESGDVAPRLAGGSRRWIIDPICGTRNFTYRLPSVATNIALLDGERPVLGVVALSPGGATLWAVAGEGAYERGSDGSDTRLQASGASRIINVDYGYALISGKSSFIASLAALLARASTHPVRSMGSSAALAYQAQGLLAGNIFQQSKPWDVTAGCLLCQEAGALVTDFDGQPWHPFGQTFLVASDLATQELLRSALRGAPVLEPLLDAWHEGRRAPGA